MPHHIHPLFNNVPIVTWDAGDTPARTHEDIDDPEQYRATGEIPASWIMRQAGLSEFAIGGVMLDETDPNTAVVSDDASFDQLFQVTSYVAQQIRDRFGVQMQLSDIVQKMIKK